MYATFRQFSCRRIHESSGLYQIQIFEVINQKKSNSHEVAVGAAVVTLDGGAGPTAAAKKPGRAPTGSTTWLLRNTKSMICGYSFPRRCVQMGRFGKSLRPRPPLPQDRDRYRCFHLEMTCPEQNSVLAFNP